MHREPHTPRRADGHAAPRTVLQLMNSGALMLYDVDWLLHPLKSELNWPLGGTLMPCALGSSRGHFDLPPLPLPPSKREPVQLRARAR